MDKSQAMLNYKNNIFSQNGEDGVINYLVKKLKIKSGTFCEFGAWDGIHLSNCRALSEVGWHGVFIEGNLSRYHDLVKNYSNNKKITTINSWVDTSKNRLDILLNKAGIKSLDFLSIDIDGLDYEIMKTLKLRPKIICIEVNAGHGGKSNKKITTKVAQNNVGQPLALFVKLAKSMGYSLVCYTGNAFFIKNKYLKLTGLPSLDSENAYVDFLKHLTLMEKEWLVLVNLGIVEPYYRYMSSELSIANIKLPLISI